MTEEEWLACIDPQPMVAFLEGRATERKARLCAAAWARLFVRCPTPSARLTSYQPWLAESTWSAQLEAAEQFADGKISAKALRATRVQGGGPYNFFREATRVRSFLLQAVRHTMHSVQREFGAPSDEAVCQMIRHIFGNPFRRGGTPPAWPAAVVSLARAVYNGADVCFALHDALLEAGHPELAAHFQGEQWHPKGCWAVDLILGRS
jgi:hypothetical protein